MRSDRDDGGELSRERRRRNVVGRAHQDDAGERRLVGDLVEQPEVVLAAGAQRQVDHPRALPDRPAEPFRENHALAGQPAAQHAHRPQSRVGGGAPDDPGARGAVTEQIVVRALGTDDLFGLRVPVEGDGPVDGTDLPGGRRRSRCRPRPRLPRHRWPRPTPSPCRWAGRSVAQAVAFPGAKASLQAGLSGAVATAFPRSLRHRAAPPRASRRSAAPRRARAANDAASAARSASAAGSLSAAWRSAWMRSSPAAASASAFSSTRPSALNASTLASASAA